MAGSRPNILPWLPERQFYSNDNVTGNLTHSFMQRSKRQRSGFKDEVCYRNRWEYHWDKMLLGRLSCKAGDMRENQGNLILYF